MWLIDCKDFEAAAGNVMLQNQTTKLRPLMPRSIPPPPNPHYFSPTFPPWNQSPSFMADYGVRREMTTLPLVSSRWNPTPEQLQALEEMYRRGVRTPSAEQIQQIAARLRRFGKIEGKNVFYWFQNHKARERQRKRRHEMELLAGKKLRHVDTNSEQRRRPGISRSCYMEVENPKKLTTSNNTTHSELYYGLDNEELQQQAMAAKQGGTESSCCYCWQQLELSSSYMSPNHSMDKFDGPGIAAAAKPFVVQESQTLELFPVKACEEEEEEEGDYIDMGRRMSVRRPHHHHHHHQFFEFLPTKDC